MASTPGTLIVGHLSRVPSDALVEPDTPSDGYEWTEGSSNFIAWFCYDAVIVEVDFSDQSTTAYNIEPFDFDTGDTVFNDVKLVFAFKMTGDTEEQIVYCGHGIDGFETHDDNLSWLEDVLEDSETFICLDGSTTPDITEWESTGQRIDRISPGFTLDDENTANAGTTDAPNYYAYASDSVYTVDRTGTTAVIDDATGTGHQLFVVTRRYTSVFSKSQGTVENFAVASESDFEELLGYLGEQNGGSNDENGDDDPDTDASIQAFLGSIGGTDTGAGTIERQDQSKMEAG